MRKRKVKVKMMPLVFFFSGFLWMSCGQMAKDSEIKADIATKAKQEIDFVGVKYSVADRVVTLSGNCPTDKAKTNVESKVKGIAGVKDVVDNITIAPVVISADHPLEQAVDSVLKNYAQAQADVKDSMVVVKGSVEGKEHEKLIAALNQLQPKKVEDELEVKQK